MGSAERREREREALRLRILEAARDILSEQGLDGLSMRAIADRIEYSPATIYTYYRDKDELIRAVVQSGFQRLGEYHAAEFAQRGNVDDPVEQYAALGLSYARFALENVAYFRVMFELPGVAHVECPRPGEEGVAMTEESSFEDVVGTVQRAIDQARVCVPDARSGAVIGWGLVHGLASLYLGGHLRDVVETPEAFLSLVSKAQQSLYQGWSPREGGAGMDRVPEPETGQMPAS